MNAPLPPIWTTGSTEVFRTGTWRSALARHVAEPSPCRAACPVNGEIASWIGRARAGDFRGAWELLVRHNPFPAIAGRICHHPCETACNRADFDEALSICKLERFVGDTAIAAGWHFPAPERERDGHVAVVGGGPAGLSAAYQLRVRGWRVTIFEASASLGGLMRHGIPAYRLARDVLDAEVARIADSGITVRLNSPLDSPEAFERLRREHDAVFVATGAARVKRLPALDYAQPWALDGAAYLAAANAGRAPALGPRLVVVGGGSAALDAARSARRAGHAVTVLALEARAQMPAQREEVHEAADEGIAFECGARIVRAEPQGGGVRLHCERVRFEPGAERGRFTVHAIDGSAFVLDADAVLSSIGQDPALEPFGDALPAQRGLVAAARDGATGADGVWAGGDVATLARFVTEAVGMGKRAAIAIDRALRARAGETLEPAPAEIGPTVGLESIATWYHPKAPRAEAPTLAPAERLAAADREVQQGLTHAQVAAEAERCFSCGTCISCDNCVVVCPDLAVRRVDGGYEVLGDYCKGCGLCVRECPTGSMVMQEEQR